VVVFAGTAMALDVRGYALINLVLIGVWLAIAVAIAREHKKLLPNEVEAKAAA